MTTTNRDALLKLASLVRPALSTQSFIPALTHIRFAGDHATAYNDVTSISVRTSSLDLECCLPGELLIKALTSLNADSVALQRVGDEAGHMLLTSGRSKLKIPSLPVKDFPLREPKDEKHDVVYFDNAILEGIRKCLFSVGADPTHPAQMGITLDVEEGNAVLYSTDNFTISRCVTKSETSLPADSPVILPTFFCEQVLTLAKAFPDDEIVLKIYAGVLRASFGKKAAVTTKTLVDLEPLDFPSIIAKHVDVSKVRKQMTRIPDTFDAAWNRALLVLSAEADKATLVAGGGKLLLSSKSSLGEAEDELEVDREFLPRKDFHVDPSLVVRAAKMCGSVAFYPRVMMLATDDASFLHLISHCSA